MRIKTLIATGLVALTGVVATTTATAAPGDADTKVTIKGAGTGDPYGTIESSNENKCADGRLVKVYEQKGGEQGGGDDEYTGVSDTASKSNGEYKWFVGQPNLDGNHYARAPRIPGCKADNSKTIDL
jgi:hypothetical protein